MKKRWYQHVWPWSLFYRLREKNQLLEASIDGLYVVLNNVQQAAARQRQHYTEQCAKFTAALQSVNEHRAHLLTVKPHHGVIERPQLLEPPQPVFATLDQVSHVNLLKYEVAMQHLKVDFILAADMVDDPKKLEAVVTCYMVLQGRRVTTLLLQK